MFEVYFLLVNSKFLKLIFPTLINFGIISLVSKNGKTKKIVGFGKEFAETYGLGKKEQFSIKIQ